jgi:hypothetical protein
MDSGIVEGEIDVDVGRAAERLSTPGDLNTQIRHSNGHQILAIREAPSRRRTNSFIELSRVIPIRRRCRVARLRAATNDVPFAKLFDGY